MKKSKTDLVVSVVVIGTCLIKAILYGGSKPPSTTNEPPLLGVGHLLCTPTPPTYASITNWNKRGAYCDWIRITFPDGFAFPHGTNLLTGVTVMAYGEIRATLHSTPTPSTYTLPFPVSLEPDASSVCYGLTPSNSFLFSWSNCCVNREATNRVDAAIELFRNGAMAITTQPTDGSQPPTTNYQPPTNPPGFVGQGQDTDWLATAFPADFAAITNKGYEAWLMEDKVGINAQNGLAKVTVTVHEMPPDGEPCYLVCGPYRVVVTHAGTYSFPLEVAVQYTARTYPTAVPLSYVADDGYRGFGGMLAAPAPRNGAPRLLGLGLPLVITIFVPPEIYAWPASISLSQAKDKIIHIWSNLPLATACVWNSVSSTTLIDWLPPSSAQIKEVFDADDILFRKMKGGEECVCTVSIVDDRPHDCCCADCTGEGCTCGCDCWRHGGSTNGTNDPPASASEP